MLEMMMKVYDLELYRKRKDMQALENRVAEALSASNLVGSVNIIKISFKTWLEAGGYIANEKA
jgi:hypothetical protein